MLTSGLRKACSGLCDTGAPLLDDGRSVQPMSSLRTYRAGLIGPGQKFDNHRRKRVLLTGMSGVGKS
jgi:hypothetical protein